MDYETRDAAELRRRLRHVYWIGGGSGSGKSTIAGRVADRRGLRLYSTDDAMPEHMRRTTSEASPYLNKFTAMDMDERWVTRSPREMLDTFGWFHGEAFSLIVEDLLKLPQKASVIVEGFRLLPNLVQPLFANARRAVWLLPTPEFRRAVFDARGGAAWGFLARTSDPHRALSNLLERDRLFTDRLAEQTQQLDLASVTVDSATTEGDLARRITGLFGLQFRGAPGAGTFDGHQRSTGRTC